jgi:hypothetical protein
MILTFIPEIAFTMTGFCSGIYNFPKLSMVNIQSDIPAWLVSNDFVDEASLGLK